SKGLYILYYIGCTMKGMDKYLDYLIGSVIILSLFGAFFPMIQNLIGNVGLDAVNISGTIHDYSFVGTLFVLFLVLGLLIFAIKGYKDHK
ncbi:unnamed protein product, partial [marine sediment metagenome]